MARGLFSLGEEVGLGYDEEHVRGKCQEKGKGLWLA